MPYDPERDPGRTHETDPTRPTPPVDPATALGLGALATALTVQGPTTTPRGGGVSLRDTIAQISALQRAIQDQTTLINGFLTSNTDTMQLVRSELQGSVKGYDQQMVTALTQTEASLKASLTALRQASTALDRVRAI